MKKYFFLLLVIPVLGISQNPTPSLKQSKSIAISNCVLHVGNGTVIQNAVVCFKDGKIVLVEDLSKSKPDISAYEQKIDAAGKHVYPGIIAMNSTLGLVEIDAVRSTNDEYEVGSINPHVRSIIAYNTDSKITPTVRTNGVLMAQVTPRGGLISGSSSIVSLDGWNWEDAVYAMDEGMHMNWPRMFAPSYWSEDGPGPMERNKNYDKAVAELTSFFADSKAYNEIPHPEKNIRMEAMKNVFNGKQTLFINCNLAKEITEAVMFAKKYGITKIAVVGAREANLVTDLLQQSNISVVLARTHELPMRTDDDIDAPFKMAYTLKQAGVLFCINNAGDMERMGARNLPFLAGTTVAYGLSKEDALSAITYNAAKIAGIANKTGSIELGKDATLFISTGDCLDMKTNNVEQAFIQGKNIDLNNSQKELDKKYRTKYKL